MQWLFTPILWHSARNPGPDDYDYSAMTPEQVKMLTAPFLFWYRDDYYFAHTTIGVITLAILISGLFNLIFHIRLRRPAQIGPPGLIGKLVAYGRYAVSRQYYIRFGRFGSMYCPPLGAIIPIVALGIWCTGLTFGVTPYKWPNPSMGNSQPIATRTGFMALGMTPMIIAFSTARNYISYVTGTSHEKLQVFHRWLAVISFVPAMIHSFMFIYMACKNGTIHMELTMDPFYWTGIIAIITLAYLVFASWSVFRKMNYELFKKLHFVFGALYIVSFFIHTQATLSSWDFFAAIAAIYVSCYLYRFGRTIYNSGIALFAYVTMLPSGPDHGLAHVRIVVPDRVSWKPGQHAYLRFWGLGFPHSFSSHPWTISSVCNTEGERAMEFVMRVHQGITARLARCAEGKVSFPIMVWVDGPYGEVPGGLDAYDHVLFLGGGSGAAFTTPLVQHQLQRRSLTKQQLQLVVAVRHADDAAWMEPVLGDAEVASAEGRASLEVYVTGDAKHSVSDIEDAIDEKMPENVKRQLVVGRPDLRAIVGEACASTAGRLAIVACGPDSFLYDIRNEVAARQLAVARGEGSAEIFLHTENYSW